MKMIFTTKDVTEALSFWLTHTRMNRPHQVTDLEWPDDVTATVEPVDVAAIVAAQAAGVVLPPPGPALPPPPNAGQRISNVDLPEPMDGAKYDEED